MPRWPSRASPLSSGSQRYLPRRRAASIRRPVRAAAKPAGPRDVAAHRARVEDVDAGDRARRARGARGRRGRPRPREARARPVGQLLRETICTAMSTAGSSTPRLAAISPYAVSAAGLLGLLLGAADAVAVEAVADAHLGGEGLHVVRALVLDDVLGDTEPVLGGELLEGGLPVQAGAQGRRRPRCSGSKSRCTTIAEVSKPPPLRWTAPITASTVSERIDALLAAAGRLLAAAELDVVADADAAADLGQRAGVDDGGAQLGQPALGEVRVGAVEGLGDDHAEHRVTEELEALVGRQATVLVGVRAVRESALEQLGVQLRIPERRAELGVVGQRSGPGQRT